MQSSPRIIPSLWNTAMCVDGGLAVINVGGMTITSRSSPVPGDRNALNSSRKA